MANIERHRRCPVCDWLLAVKRLRRHPRALLCGSTECKAEYERRRHNRACMLYQRRKRKADRLARLRMVRLTMGPTLRDLSSYQPPEDGSP